MNDINTETKIESPRTIRRDRTNKEIEQKKTPIMAVILWILSVFTVETLLKSGFGLTTPILTGIYIVFLFWYYRDEKKSWKQILLAVSTFLVSLSLIITYNPVTYFITFWFLLYLVPTLAVSISGFSQGKLFSLGKIGGIITGCIGKTFLYLEAPMAILNKSNKNSGFKVIVGIIAALPIGAIFIGLFNSADAVFKVSLDNLLESLNFDIWSIFGDLFFGTIIAIFLIAMHLGLKVENKRLEKEGFHQNWFDNTIVTTYFAVLVPIYALFIVIQFKYLFTTGAVLPGNISYSQYAVSGFYQLCSIVSISSLMIIFALAFTKKVEGRYRISLKTVLTLLILGNFVIVTSAFFRMFKYIGVYDLSVKRLIVSWIITVIVFILLGIIVKIWKSDFPVLSYVGVMICFMILILNFSNVNMIVGEYNVGKYIESDFKKELDLDYLAELGPGAVGATARLLEEDAPDKALYLSVMTQQKYLALEKNWRNMTVDNIGSRKYFEEYNIGGYKTNSDPKEYNYDIINEFDDYGFNMEGLNKEGKNRNEYK